MPMLKFTLSYGQPIWIDPDKVVAVGSGARGGTDMSLHEGGGPGAKIYLDVINCWSVQESLEDVVAKIEQAKDRPQKHSPTV
jgi:hypothetical protein